jgi:UDP-glucose 4-epimerase
VREDAPTFPQSFYGVGKLASEHYLRLYEQYGIRSTALRLFNVYGPGQNMKNLRQGMVSIFLAMLADTGHIHVKGSPDRYRDFVHIDDVVRAFLLCLTRETSQGKALNIGGSGRVTVGTLVDMLRKTHGGGTVEYSGSTAGDIHGIHADITAAGTALGYAPRVSLEDGLRRMYDWYAEVKTIS